MDLLYACAFGHLRDHPAVITDADVKHQNLKWPTTIIHGINGKTHPACETSPKGRGGKVGIETWGQPFPLLS